MIILILLNVPHFLVLISLNQLLVMFHLKQYIFYFSHHYYYIILCFKQSCEAVILAFYCRLYRIQMCL